MFSKFLSFCEILKKNEKEMNVLSLQEGYLLNLKPPDWFCIKDGKGNFLEPPWAIWLKCLGMKDAKFNHGPQAWEFYVSEGFLFLSSWLFDVFIVFILNPLKAFHVQLCSITQALVGGALNGNEQKILSFSSLCVCGGVGGVGGVCQTLMKTLALQGSCRKSHLTAGVCERLMLC